MIWLLAAIGAILIMMALCIWRYIRPSFIRFANNPKSYGYYMLISGGPIFWIKTENGWKTYHSIIALIYLISGTGIIIAALVLM